jgi:hypothetical protein
MDLPSSPGTRRASARPSLQPLVTPGEFPFKHLFTCQRAPNPLISLALLPSTAPSPLRHVQVLERLIVHGTGLAPPATPPSG